MRRGFRAAIRAGAFVRKEATEVLRQPRLLVLLVLGPFLILLLFGAGLIDRDPPMRTLFVAPPDSELTQSVARFATSQADRLRVQGLISDLGEAQRQLEEGEVDLVVAFPADVSESVRSNRQAVITLYHSQLDPVEGRAIELFMQSAVDEANRQILASTMRDAQEESEDLLTRVAEARRRAGQLQTALERDDASAAQVAALEDEMVGVLAAAGPALALMGASGTDTAAIDERLESLASLTRGLEVRRADDIDPEEVAQIEQDLAETEDALVEFRSLSPQVMAAPFRGRAVRVAAEGVQLRDFYAPAVAVVLLQHLLVTALGLSLVREQELGTVQLYRVAPLQPGEIVVGKYIAHLLVAGVVAAALLALLVLGLGVPMRGDPVWLVVSVAAVCFAAAGLGVLVSLAARSDTQAVQYAMLLLLMTVFFSGFILSLERFIPQVRWVAWLVPATYGVDLLRDVMLRGVAPSPWLLAALTAMGLGLGVIGWAWLRRRLRTG